jgi:hypothetical protein
MSQVLRARLEPKPKKSIWGKVATGAAIIAAGAINPAFALGALGVGAAYLGVKAYRSIKGNPSNLNEYSKERERVLTSQDQSVRLPQTSYSPILQPQSPTPVSYPRQSPSPQAEDVNEGEDEDFADEEEYGEEDEEYEDEDEEYEEYEDEEDYDEVRAKEEGGIREVVTRPTKPLPAQSAPKKTMAKAPSLKLEPRQPKIVHAALPTFMDDPEILGDTFLLVANRHKGQQVAQIAGIEQSVNQVLSVAITTPKVPVGVGVVIIKEGATFVWNTQSDLKEVEKIRLQLQKTYLAIAMIRSLQEKLGYAIERVFEQENFVGIEAIKDQKTITVFLNATDGSIMTDFGHFKNNACFNEAKKLLDSLSDKGVTYQPLGTIPKDDSGVPILEMAIGDITIWDQTEDDRRKLLESFQRLGIASVIDFDSPCG